MSADSESPWALRYAPQRLEDCIGNDVTRERLLRYGASENLIFVGPSGVGKTTWAKLTLAKLLKPWTDAGLALSWLVFSPSLIDNVDSQSTGTTAGAIARRAVGHDASDDALTYVGLATADAMLRFTKRSIPWPSFGSCPRFIFLDSADNLHDEVQTSLCRIDGDGMLNVKFVLCCHDLSLLRADLVSRAAHVFLDVPTPERLMPLALSLIAEGCPKDDADAARVATLVARHIPLGVGQVISALQIFAACYPRVGLDALSTEPPADIARRILDAVRSGHLRQAMDILHREVWTCGFRAAEFLGSMAAACGNDEQDLSVVSKAYADVLRGADSQLQMAHVLGLLYEMHLGKQE